MKERNNQRLRTYVVTAGDWYEIEQINKSIHNDMCETYFEQVRAKSHNDARRIFFYGQPVICKYTEVKARLLSNPKLKL